MKIINTTDIGQIVLSSLDNGLITVVNFIPKFIAGLVILLIGIVISTIIRRVIIEVLHILHLESFLRRYDVPHGEKELSWTNILSEIIRWFLIVLFLIPTADVWGLPQIVTVLNTFLLYLPNVFVSAIIAVIGLVFARLAYDVILNSTRNLSKNSSRAIATTSRWSITIFVLLAVLNQLGVASDLVKILFTGFVAMIAIAGGIAFGLGGKDEAKDMLGSMRKKLK